MTQDALKEKLRALAGREGFCGFGTAAVAGEPDADYPQFYHDFLSRGDHAGMTYLESYTAIRDDISLLVPAARSVIALAASYYTPVTQPVLRWARYALGDDYHDVLRKHLAPLADTLRGEGFQARICVDTAPLNEKYWAVRAGLGTIGLNTLLLTPAGSYVVLGFIVTDAQLPPDSPAATPLCTRCGKCVRACPGNVLRGDSTMRTAGCRSYLTIEYRGELPPDLHLDRRIYGCDICQEVCPANSSPAPASFVEFTPRQEILSLTPAEISAMTQDRFSVIFRRSAIKRVKLAGLKRNCAHL